MTRQVKHIRHSKKGKLFRAGRRIKVPILAKPLGPPPTQLAINPGALQKFKALVSLVKSLGNEVVFHFEPGALRLQFMDPANVAMLRVRANYGSPPNLLRVGKGKLPLNAGISVPKLYAILSGMKTKDEVGMVFANNKLALVNSVTLARVELPVMDLEEKEQKFPDLKQAYTIRVGSKDFVAMLEASESVADVVKLTGGVNYLAYLAEGDVSKAGGHLKGTSTGDLALSSKFSIEYLKKVKRLAGLSDQFVLKLAKNYPLWLVVEARGLTVDFVLAPRISDEDIEEAPKTESKVEPKPAEPEPPKTENPQEKGGV